MPSGAKARAEANLEAIRLSAHIAERGAPATHDEQRRLAAWSSWGAIPQIFDDTHTGLAAEREQLRELLTDAQWDAARRTTINAHYTNPAYVTAIWETMTSLGFTGGRVLEPGCGSGTFIGLAPAGADMMGVELDPITAQIAAQLYPQARILNESFADTRASGGFDAVVGNVPFGEVKLTDPLYNAAGHRMHNHFLIKSLAITKPGGVVAALTSRYTLDAQNPAARRELASLGDLVGAVRLPAGAHRRTAGTDVVTDLIVLRRRAPGADPTDDTLRWLDTTAGIDVDGTRQRINQYYADHPEQVLGTLSIRSGMFARDDLTVVSDQPVEPALRAALDRVTDYATARSLHWNAVAGDDLVIAPTARVGAAPDLFPGHITEPAPNVFAAYTPAGGHDEIHVPRTQVDELRHLLQLRDILTDLLQAEAATSDDTAEIADLRNRLNNAYDTYLAAHGPLNRFTTRPGRSDPATGRTKQVRTRPPVMRIFGSDPFAATVMALEHFDAQTQTATKAAIMHKRVVAPRRPALGADTPADALAISLDTYGEPRLADIADLLGIDEAEARPALTGLVYDDPEIGRLVAAAEYLSGNVRTKLTAAIEAAADDDRYTENVDALRAVQPLDLTPSEIDARLGAAWIGAADVQAFLRQTLSDHSIVVEHVTGSDWKVRGGGDGVEATSTWGTERMPATRIADRLLRQADIKVYDNVVDGPDILNPVETEAANEKAQLLNERFSEWVWEDPARADRLAREYNDKFNAIVLRSYDTAHMTLPGIAKTWQGKPRPHQLAAVARMIAEPNAGLFHEVGAGKTAAMTMGVMELKRLGLVNKPALVVPNHMLNQFSSEFLQIYPQARILAAGMEDLTGDKRRAFVARATTGDWDAIIMTRTAFAALPVSRDTVERYHDEQLAPLRAALDNLQRDSGNSMTIKRVEKAVLAAEERLKEKLSTTRDPGVTFEQTGIDYLVVDELHDYKNLLTPSNIQDAAITPGSVRAQDLHMKVEYLRRRHGNRAITGATATPIANSITEAYVMQRYLRPELLTAAGIPDFDTWAATFGQTTTEMEISPTGAGWRLKSRFAKFRNIPEFLRMWHVAADIKTADDLDLPTPELAARPDGHRAPQTIVVEPGEAVLDYVKRLGDRAEAIRARAVDPHEDNMLKVSSDGRKAALDMRLVTSGDTGPADLFDGAWSPTPSKVDVAAARIARIWSDHRDRIYTVDGSPHPRPGALQIVFSDLGTPGEHWNVYDELKTQLTTRGVPAEQIAFIHDAKNDREKAALFAAARTGQIQVLIGSTAKMGVGTNVQDRAIALHHLDCPWRPADLAQREGRILRQGNQNPEIQIYRYVTEATFDTYLWQTVERKARFIAQVMKNRLDSREVEDIGDDALSYNEVKALASGNPLLLDKAKADAEVARLERLERSHARTQLMLEHRIQQDTQYIATLEAEIPRLEAAIAKLVDTRGDAFRMQIGDVWYTERAAAAQALGHRLTAILDEPINRYRSTPHPIGHLGGHTFHAQVEIGQNGARLAVTVESASIKPFTVSADDAKKPTPGLVVRLENALNTLPRTLASTNDQIEATHEELNRAQGKLGQPFPHTQALTDARQFRDKIKAELTADTDQEAPRPSLAQLATSHLERSANQPAAHQDQPQPGHPHPQPGIHR